MSITVPIAIWTVDGLTKVFADALPPDPQTSELVLAGARGECEVAQIAIRAIDRDIVVTRPEGAKLRSAGAESEISDTNIRCQFVDLVPVRHSSQGVPREHLLRDAPRYFPDPICLEDCMRIPAGQTRSIWIRMTIPRDAAPGNYTGSIFINFDNGSESVPVRLTVWPVQLPQRIQFSMTLWVWPNILARYHCVRLYSEEFWQVLTRYAREMAEHRQDTIYTPIIGADGLIDITRKANGSFAFDFGNFDRWVNTFVDAGFEQIEGSHLFDSGMKQVRFNDDAEQREIRIAGPRSVQRPSENEAYFSIATALIAAVRDHVRKQGWADRYLQHIYDEPSIEQIPAYSTVAQLVRSIWPDVRIIDAADSDPAIFDSIDVRVPLIDNRFAFSKSPSDSNGDGKTLWAYTCNHPRGRFPNSYLDQPLIMTRVLFWIMWRYGVRGFLYYAMGYWESQHDVPRHAFDPHTGESSGAGFLFDPWLDPCQNATWRCPPGSWGFVYPPRDPCSLDPEILTPHMIENFQRVRQGLPSRKEHEGPSPKYIRPVEGVVGSIRWEQLREGIEDYGLLQILRDRIDTAEQNPGLRALASDTKSKFERVLDRVATDWTTYTLDPRDIEQARAEIVQLIASFDSETGRTR